MTIATKSTSSTAPIPVAAAAARVVQDDKPHGSSNGGNSNNSNGTCSPGKLHTNRQVRGAAVAAGVTGLVLLGPAAGLLAAGGAALATTSGKGTVSKAARATGDSCSDLGTSAKKFDWKHGVTEAASKATRIL
mmetsp:Transcript_25360/g.53462  ORF Transcript_25360/g.53462 Transcript_25360/m.53462 type:complete len:133 (-) Transcript_25360:17-415(-)